MKPYKAPWHIKQANKTEWAILQEILVALETISHQIAEAMKPDPELEAFIENAKRLSEKQEKHLDDHAGALWEEKEEDKKTMQ